MSRSVPPVSPCTMNRPTTLPDPALTPALAIYKDARYNDSLYIGPGAWRNGAARPASKRTRRCEMSRCRRIDRSGHRPAAEPWRVADAPGCGMRDVAPQTKRSRLASRLSPGRLTPLLLAAGTILAGCGSGAPGQGACPAGQPAVRDSAGLAIVENGGLDVPFGVVPVHVADLIPPDSALTAVPWGVAVDPAAGRIYLADAMGARVA